MVNEQNSFKLAVLVSAILALLFVAYLVTKRNAGDNEQQSAQPRTAVVDKVNVDFAQNPEKFPAEIPVEAGARITQNYNATTPQGIFQATKVFETSQSLSANLALYTKFFNDNGWNISATIDQPTIKMVAGEKDGKNIQVSITENKVSKIRTVSINYVEKL